MKTVLILAAACIVAVNLAGCSKSLSPEMKGLSMTDEEVTYNRNVEMNQNYRMISDDLARTFYLDHPSRLHPFPITYTSGQGR